MLGEEDKDRPSGDNRRIYARSASWTDRSPRKVSSNSRPQWKSKVRACLPPLQPLSITKPKVEEWPSAGSDDLGIWPGNPPTPGVRPNRINEKSSSEQPPKEFLLKKDKLAFFDKECSRIVDHIYLGSDVVAKNREILRANGITHVLNCVGFVCQEYFKSDFVYKTLWLQDSPSEDITSILYDVFDYFEDVREQGGRVLVHCCQGISRSTSLVIAYLMWKERQSFEDAFQHVKAARGVTNPNMGFACQLLQCQKRVHATPASPNSALRMYRMAPHSSYDPLHLVPKMLTNPGVQGLDSRGAFVVHVPCGIYVWIGKTCVPVVSDNARAAAFQVMRYERAQGPIKIIKEDEEPSEFWDALDHGQIIANGDKTEMGETTLLIRRDELASSSHPCVRQRKVESYDLDYEIFHGALTGGVVPPFPSSETGSETCLPTRENGWSRLRRKFTSGIMRRFITSAKFNHDATQSSDEQEKVVHSCKEDYPVSAINSSIPSSPDCDSPNSFSSFVTNSPRWTKDICDEENSPLIEQFVLPMAPRGSPDSFSSFLVRNQKFSSTSPSLSPTTSDYSGSFTFSPSSSNWSNLSYLSVHPSPSGSESTDPSYAKDLVLGESVCLPCKNTSSLVEETISTDHAPIVAGSLPCSGTCSFIVEHRGSNPPPQMMLPSVDDSSEVSANLVRSWSFSLAEVGDDSMMDAECNKFQQDASCEMSREEAMLDADNLTAYDDFRSGIQIENEDESSHCPLRETTNRNVEISNMVLYHWPSMHKTEMHVLHTLDSRSVYIMFVPNISLGRNDSDVLYVWVGRDVPCEESQHQVIDSDVVCKESHLQWETIGRNFLIQYGLATNCFVQMVREGQEPEHLLKHIQGVSYQTKVT